MTTPDIIEFATDPQLLNLTLSPAQEALLRALYGRPLSPEHIALFHECTGRSDLPTAPFAEATVIAGARSGKDSRIAAPVVLYEALFGGHEQHLARGERAVIPLVAQDQRATGVAFGYIREYLTQSPLLAGEVADVLALELELTNGIRIACFPSTLRSLRGWSIPAGVLDELAFFRLTGQANADTEVQASIRRGMVAFPETRLVKISTPYMRSGVLYDDFVRAFGHNDPDLLVWRASTVLMNPTIRAERLERERRLDSTRYAREYEGEFGEDVDGFLPPGWVDDAIRPGRYKLPPRDGVRYHAAVDPSGGGPDAFTLVVAHAEGVGADARIVVDVVRGWSRRGSRAVDLTGAVREIADILTGFHLRQVTDDRHAAGWVRERFEQAGVRYVQSAADSSTSLSELSPLFAEGRIDLLDHPLLAQELKALERRLRAGGKTIIEHPRGGHDDYAVALALATGACLPDTRPRASISRMLKAGQVTRASDSNRYVGRIRIPRF